MSDNHLTHWRPSYKNGQRLRRSATIGGTDFPSWLPPDRHDLTVLDVPGEYSLLANQPLGVPLVGHPVGTIMAIADRAGDILAARRA